MELSYTGGAMTSERATHLLVANPTAQSGKNMARIERARQLLREAGIRSELLPTAPGGATVGLVREALDCLHDQVRSGRGLGTLAENTALDAAAVAHSDDMIARAYFDHDSPDGGTFDQIYLKN